MGTVAIGLGEIVYCWNAGFITTAYKNLLKYGTIHIDLFICFISKFSNIKKIFIGSTVRRSCPSRIPFFPKDGESI
jgi:hypothetical protein